MKIPVFSHTEKRLHDLVKQMGWINAALYLSNRIANACFSGLSVKKYYFVAQFISESSFLPESRGRQLRIVELFASDIDLLNGLRPVAVIKDRYQQGAVCLAAFKDEKFAGCLWYVKDAYKEDEVRCLYHFMSPQAVWDFDVYVEPSFRLSPVFLKLWDAASAKLKSEACCWSLSRISAFNVMSMSAHKRMGAKVLGWSVFLTIGIVQFSIASFSPFFHISFSENSFPVYRLNLPKL
jgi:hypothetical protein